MLAAKAHIMEQLKRELLALQGFATPGRGQVASDALGPINDAFPNSIFPLRAVHEFLAGTAEDRAATGGFITGVLSGIMRGHGVVVWVGSKLQVFPHAFNAFGVDPQRIIFASADNQRDVLWAVEESLKCPGLTAVVGEMHGLSFDVSRRLQLAVEKSHVTGFIINRNTKSINANACVSRWRISTLASEINDELPGVGFPRWNVELLKVRNGRAAQWEVEWRTKAFHFASKSKAVRMGERRKTG